MFNLRKLGNPPVAQSTGMSWSQFSAPNFAVPQTFVGNIGEPLVHDELDPHRQDDSELVRNIYSSERNVAQQLEA